MKTTARLALAAALLWLGGCRSTSTTDVTVKQKTSTTGAIRHESESTQYWTDKLMVVDDPASRMMVDFVARRVIVLDKQQKTYAGVTFDAMRASMDAERKRVAEETAGYPEDVKNALRGMGQALDDLGEGVEVKPTGQRAQIAGYDAEEFSFSGSAVNGTLWISKDLPLPLGEEQKRAYLASTAGMKAAGRQFALAMVQLNAIPLRTEMHMALGPDGTVTTNEVVEVRRGTIPADVTAIPDDYQPRPTP